MKRTLSAILVMILCLTLCACGASAPAPTPEPTPNSGELLYNKYSAIIDALEAEDYDGAAEALEALRPAPEVTEVEITMDNLWDYFEIVEKRNEQTDAMGSLTHVEIQYVLSLKNNLLLAETEMYPTDVAVGYEYDYTETQYYGSCTLDFENWSCDGNAEHPFGGHESKMLHFPKSGYLYYAVIGYFSGIEGGSILVNENFEILNASGTLYLVSK